MTIPNFRIIELLRLNLPRGSRLLLAVSGGIDSIALLSACASLQAEMNLELAVAHVDHGLRDESKSDAIFVENYSKNLKLDFHKLEIQPSQKFQNQNFHNKNLPNENIENWGRQERYKFFSKILAENNYDWIVTAHHADDLIETFFMRLLANKELKTIAVREEQRRLIRPILDLFKTDLKAYCDEHALKHIEDESNLSNAFTRNKIRNILLPCIYQNFPEASPKTLLNRILLNTEDLDFLTDKIQADLKELETYVFESKDFLRGLSAKLNVLDLRLAWRLVDTLLKNKLGFNIGRKHSLRVVDFILEQKVGVELPSGASLLRKNGGIKLITRTLP